MSRIITIGEPLCLFNASETGELRNVQNFRRYVSGAELSYAVGMARLGHEVTFVTKVGSDPLGLHIIDFLRKENINTQYVELVDDYPTGIEIKTDNAEGWPDFYYYRENTAATLLSKEDIKKIDFSQYDHFHFTGIPVSLSLSCRQAVMQMIHEAHLNDMTVSFDPNLRPRLWDDEVEMRKVLNGITILCDLVFPELLEAEKLLGTDNPDEIADFYISAGVKTVVIKMGQQLIFVKNKKNRFTSPSYQFKNIVDLMGVGEGFCVGVTSALLEGRNLPHSIARGRIIGSHIVEDVTSYAKMPTREELISWIQEIYKSDEIINDKFGSHIPSAKLKAESLVDAIEKKHFVHDQIEPIKENPKDSLDAYLEKAKAKDEARIIAKAEAEVKEESKEESKEKNNIK